MDSVPRTTKDSIINIYYMYLFFVQYLCVYTVSVLFDIKNVPHKNRMVLIKLWLQWNEIDQQAHKNKFEWQHDDILVYNDSLEAKNSKGTLANSISNRSVRNADLYEYKKWTSPTAFKHYLRLSSFLLVVGFSD